MLFYRTLKLAMCNSFINATDVICTTTFEHPLLDRNVAIFTVREQAAIGIDGTFLQQQYHRLALTRLQSI